MLGESKRLFTNARNTAARLARYNGLAAEPLYHPPPLAGKLTAGPFGDYVLSVGRLEANKRVDLIVRALAHVDRGVRLVVVGEGPLRRAARGDSPRPSGVADRVTFTGGVDERRSSICTPARSPSSFRPSTRTTATSRSKRFSRASRSSRPPTPAARSSSSRTASPASSRDPTPEALGARDRAARRRPRARAQSLGDAGYDRARAITWDGVVDRLMAEG